MPVARVGYERIRRGPDNFVFGGGVSLSDVIALSPHRVDPGSGPLLVLNTRVDYTDRRSSDPLINLANPRSGRTDVFASAGIDAPAGSTWRVRGWAGYQRLDSDFLKGFATFGVSARPQRGDELTYGWNFSLSGNFGAGNYRGMIFTISRRFLQPRRGRN